MSDYRQKAAEMLGERATGIWIDYTPSTPSIDVVASLLEERDRREAEVSEAVSRLRTYAGTSHSNEPLRRIAQSLLPKAGDPLEQAIKAMWPGSPPDPEKFAAELQTELDRLGYDLHKKEPSHG